MFTGIIEELGTIAQVEQGTNHYRVSIKADKVLQDVKLGDSIAVNGICLTVTHFTTSQFVVDVMPETLKSSSLQTLGNGSLVNLERAMSANGRFGGHMMSGHVDGLGHVVSKKKEGNAVYFQMSTATEHMKYLVPKGSVAVDGISLTVVHVSAQDFSISIIPHTIAETTLQATNVGDAVNLEFDLVSKYIEGLLSQREGGSHTSDLSLNKLKEHGFA